MLQWVSILIFTAEYGTAPSADELNVLVQFTNPQCAYGQQIGVMDPAVYAYQSLGAALASTASNFQISLAHPILPTRRRLLAIFSSQPRWKHDPVQHFLEELTFFENVYTAAGGFGSQSNIDLLARGAVYGQMLDMQYEIDPTAVSASHVAIIGTVPTIHPVRRA